MADIIMHYFSYNVLTKRFTVNHYLLFESYGFIYNKGPSSSSLSFSFFFVTVYPFGNIKCDLTFFLCLVSTMTMMYGLLSSIQPLNSSSLSLPTTLSATVYIIHSIHLLLLFPLIPLVLVGKLPLVPFSIIFFFLSSLVLFSFTYKLLKFSSTVYSHP